ncbi:hypothetical protein NT01EI_2284 [Edwardsiella ictaluri 93-146]|uniref:Uncharacterized protein n=1 Tax=Edwardsiella ictaluri (strain 93-146) TaxID=634503 RepID=C5BH25_EDWI9|nr:hypothetical protein NT01EI_2284 [Edwardsiella ictaluri 93-146]
MTLANTAISGQVHQDRIWRLPRRVSDGSVAQCTHRRISSVAAIP